MFGKIVSGVVGGLIVAVLGTLIVTIAMANDPETVGRTGSIAFIVFWVIGLLLAVTASRAGKSWRRLLIVSAALSFAMPLSSFIFTSLHVTEVASQGGEYASAAAAGAVIGGGVVTAISGFVGFFMGLIFLVIGLLTGRDKQVIIIKEGEIG